MQIAINKDKNKDRPRWRQQDASLKPAKFEWHLGIILLQFFFAKLSPVRVVIMAT